MRDDDNQRLPFIFVVVVVIMDHLKNCRPKVWQGDNSSCGVFRGDDFSGGNTWDDDSSGGVRTLHGC